MEGRPEIAQEADQVDKRSWFWSAAKRAAEQLGAAGVLIVMCIVLTILSSAFFTVGNLTDLIRQVSVIGIVGFGETFVIITGGIDLSVGSIVAVSSAVMGIMMIHGVPLELDIAAAILIGAAIGSTNGFLIAFLGMPSFIVTLGMLGVGAGLALVITGGLPIFGLPGNFQWLGNGFVGPIPVPVIVLFVVFGLAWFVLAKTVFGLHTYALGGNTEACRLCGIRVRRHLLGVYALSGALAALAGVVLTARLNSAQPTAGSGYELDAIAAVIIGGASLSGGIGGVGGTLIGTLLMGVINNGLALLNVSAYWVQTIIGVVIIVAVLVDQVRRSEAGGFRRRVFRSVGGG